MTLLRTAAILTLWGMAACSSGSDAAIGRADADGGAVGGPVRGESANCTRITGPGTALADSVGQVWTLAGTPGDYVVYVDGRTAGYSAKVTALFYANHRVYKTNSVQEWSYWVSNTWNAAPDPTPMCVAASPLDAGTAGSSDGGGSTSSEGQDAATPGCGPKPGGGSATIHTIGRFDTSDPSGPKFSWPGSTVVTTFNGTGISAQLADNVGNNYFVVTVDGGAPTAFRTKPGTSTYTLATGLASGQHTVRFVKRTESFDGIVQLLGLTPTGGGLVATPEPWARRIEFIGDSITCGYGVLGGSCSNPQVDQEDWTATAGARVATQLQAAPTTLAYSGIGMYRANTGSTNDQMPTRFLRTLADSASSTWAFTASPPDVVVINLGTNDFAKGDPGAAFETAYTTFVQQAIRSHYPNAWVVVALSPMVGGPARAKLSSYLNGVVSTVKAAGDNHITYFEYDAQPMTGCLGHPDVVANEAMAAKLAPFIENLTGWCP